MLSIELIRRNPDLVRQALAKRFDESVTLDRVLGLDEERRKLIAEAEALRAKRNEASRAMGQVKRQTNQTALQQFVAWVNQQLPEERRPKTAVAELQAWLGEQLPPIMRDIGERIKAAEARQSEIEAQLTDLLLRIPNIPHESVPVGKDESANIVIKTWGEQPRFDFTPLPHWDVATKLGIVDFERGVKLSGARFYVLVGAGAKLERSLIDWMIDVHTKEHGYTEVATPYVVKREAMVGTGQLPKFGEDMYHCEEDDLFLIPTAEVPVTNLHREEIIEAGRLPLYYVCYTACFRREAGSAGKDTKGMVRVHQFDKVEMVKFVEPETSYDELEKLTDNACDILRRLGIPYQLKLMVTGDLGFSAAKKYDPEAWFPGQARYVEISSCSNFESFQARRANIRYRPTAGARPEFVHTLNGSGLAVGRTFAALLENFQQADGTVVIPEALRPYTKFEAITPTGVR